MIQAAGVSKLLIAMPYSMVLPVLPPSDHVGYVDIRSFYSSSLDRLLCCSLSDVCCSLVWHMQPAEPRSNSDVMYSHVSGDHFQQNTCWAWWKSPLGGVYFCEPCLSYCRSWAEQKELLLTCCVTHIYWWPPFNLLFKFLGQTKTFDNGLSHNH